MKTRAAVLHEFGKPMVIEELELEPPGDDDVLVRNAYCAVCHSDIHSMNGEHGHPPLPAVGGHEISGFVEAVGRNVSYVRPGDRVVVTIPAVGCGQCYFCTIGKPEACENRGLKLALPGRYIDSHGRRLTQLGGVMGGFAEHTVVSQYNVVKISDAMPLEPASLLACGVISGFFAVVNRAKVTPFSSVVVMGTGGVGLNAVQGAVFSGAFPVIAVDVLDSKLELARKFGATHTVNAKKESDPVAAVRKLTQSGKGADFVFVTVAGTGPLRQGFLMAGGAVGMTVIIGHAGEERLSDFSATEVMGKILTGCAMGQIKPRVDIPRLEALYLAGRLKIDELISNRYPIERINEAFTESARGEVLRNIILF